MIKDSEHIVLFDGVCRLCSNLVRFISDRDKNAKFRFFPLQSESGQVLLKKFGLPAGDLDSVVYIRGGKYFIKSSAVLHLLKSLGGVWKLLFALIIIPGFIRDFAYEMVAKTRYRIFGRQESCAC